MVPQCSITLFQYALRGDLGTYLYLMTDLDEPWVRSGKEMAKERQW